MWTYFLWKLIPPAWVSEARWVRTQNSFQTSDATLSDGRHVSSQGVLLSAPQPCPPGMWGDDGLRPYRGSQRPPSSRSPRHPISTLALSLGFTILWGITIACLAHRRNYSCNYLRNCFTVRWFYQTLWGYPRASVCFTESKSLPPFSS